MPSWRSTGRSRAPRSRFLSRRRLQICDVGRRLRLHARAAGFGPRPPVTGWFAEFEDLSLRLAASATRGMPADFSARPSTRRRCIDSSRSSRCLGRTTSRRRGSLPMSRRFSPDCSPRSVGPRWPSPASQSARRRPHARFLAFGSPRAQRWHDELLATIASPMCAATCCGSASAFTTTSATSPGSLRLLGRLA